MKFDPDQHHRRSIRLKGYDYCRPSAYFVTICAFNKECLFGRIFDGQMHANDYGKIVQDEWFRSAHIRHEIALDAWLVMPNHVHGIVNISDTGPHLVRPLDENMTVGADGVRPAAARRVCRGAGERRSPLPMPPRSLASLIAGFKSATTRRINEIRNTVGPPVWQRNYYERIIRDEDELNKIREYVVINPLRWASDRQNPAAQGLPEGKRAWE